MCVPTYMLSYFNFYFQVNSNSFSTDLLPALIILISGLVLCCVLQPLWRLNLAEIKQAGTNGELMVEHWSWEVSAKRNYCWRWHGPEEYHATLCWIRKPSICSEHQSWYRTLRTAGTATLDGSFLRTCSQAASVHVNLLVSHSLIHYCIFLSSFRHNWHYFVYFLLSVSLAKILAPWGQGTCLLFNPLANNWHKKYLSNKL